ncbi:MAG: hypothetical protein R3D88_05340 [Alphaproteobacteria bacterium]|nr:hypothetical protein [Alphaproteobacteria bacterium]
MSDIFREVDEALQQDKLLAIWNEYKNTIIAALVILITTTALTTFYHNWNAKRNGEETARLIQALETEKPETVLPTIIEDTRKNHATVATFIAAGMALEENKKEEAAALYKESAESSGTPRDLRDLARILYIKNANEPSIDILKPLLSNPKSPWIWHAKIEAAVLSAEQNDYPKALEYLDGFQNVTTIPLSLKQRGKALHHIYSLKNTSKDQ